MEKTLVLDTDISKLSGNIKLMINCYCGLTRCLPDGLQIGDTFSLVTCPKCGSGLKGIFRGDQVEAL